MLILDVLFLNYIRCLLCIIFKTEYNSEDTMIVKKKKTKRLTLVKKILQNK